ncbi:MAG TPA: glycoside hydrolase family 5 protein [Balneolales bacterium]|nr:glycoside hydrolase family 5 protein [Balneolales bacterium]
MKNLFKIIFISFLTAFTLNVHAQSSTKFITVKGKKVIAPNGQELHLKGIGLGNWLLPEGYMWRFKKAVSPRQINDVVTELIGPAAARNFWKKYHAEYITKKDIAYLKKIGMNSVRIPINYRVLTSENHPGIWLKSGFETLDHVIQWCKEEGLYVILDMHAAPGGQTGENIDDGWGYPFLFKSPESQKRVIRIWKKLAARYHNNPNVLGYDLLNEPIPNFKEYASLNKYLVPLYKRITHAIREVDPNHIIIVEGAQWATNFKVFGKPFDSKMIYSFHKYWMPPKQDQFQEYVDFSNKYNVPIWLGESGENKDEWVDQFRKLLEKNDIGWSFWPYKKLKAKSCIVTVKPPANWDKITTFAADWGDSFKNFRKDRPSMQDAQKILNQLLVNIKFQNCTPNPGYIKALGLQP